jgi:hypothetical protein
MWVSLGVIGAALAGSILVSMRADRRELEAAATHPEA